MGRAAWRHEAAGTLLAYNLGLAIVVSTIHTVAMVAAGGATAWIVYRYAGLQVLSKAWIKSDVFWAASLILVGVAALLSS